MPDALPEAFGRYRVTGLLGRGAMGAVYRAHDPLIDRMVAIKVVRAELLDGEAREDFRTRFRLEAQAAGRCSHPAIVAVYDFSDSGDAPYIVMELVEGETLHARLRARGALPSTEAIGIAAAILGALDYAHTAGITHRDIKPANVLLLPDARVKVMDFGVARLDRAALTQTGMMVGTPSYMAPEQVLGTRIDSRADLFATGIVLYEMLTGRTPFAGDTATQILYKVAHTDLSLGDELDRVPPPLGSVLRRALTRDPECRYSSAAEFASALRAAGAPARPEPPSDATVFVPPRRAGSSPARSGPATLDPALLTRAERELASHIGPIARVLVRKAAQSAAGPDEFVRSLAESIPDPKTRTQFMARTGRHTPPGAATAPSAAGSSLPGPASVPAASAPGRSAPPASESAPLPPAAVESAQRALATVIGPIAAVLARKAAAPGGSVAEFHDRLEAALDRDADRAAFRRALRGADGGRSAGSR